MECRGTVALITLNRPAAMNAVNAGLSRALGAVMAELAADPDLRVGVVTGAGRAFCAGADLKELAAGRTVHDTDHPERGFAGFVRHLVDKPVIAAVNGLALGGGTEILLACDLAVMSTEARLGLPEVKRGLVAAAGGVLQLHRQIPPKIAAEAVFTGEPLDAQTALRWGLVNRAVPAEEVLDTALVLAERIAANAPLAVRASKRMMMRSAAGSDLESAVWEVNEASSPPSVPAGTRARAPLPSRRSGCPSGWVRDGGPGPLPPRRTRRHRHWGWFGTRGRLRRGQPTRLHRPTRAAGGLCGQQGGPHRADTRPLGAVGGTKRHPRQRAGPRLRQDGDDRGRARRDARLLHRRSQPPEQAGGARRDHRGDALPRQPRVGICHR